MAYLFNALTDVITAGTAAQPSAGTVAAWVYITSYTDSGNYAHVFDQRDGSSNICQLAWGVDGKPYGGWYLGGPDQRVFSAAALSLNTWYSLVLTWDLGTTTTVLYVNGSNVASTGSGPTSTPSLAGFSRGIGNIAAGGYEVLGSLAELSFANVAWTAAEAASHAKAMSALAIRRGVTNHYPLVRALNDFGPAGVTASNSGADVATHCRIFNPHSRRGRRFTTAAGGGFKAAWARQRSGVIGAGRGF